MKKFGLIFLVLFVAVAASPPVRAQSLDPAFAPHTIYAAGLVYSALEQPDGKRVAVGSFSRIDGTPASQLVRFNTNGTIDAAFQLNAGNVGPVYRTALLNNGQLLLTSFTNRPLTAGAITRNALLRLNADGTADASFDVGTGPATAPGGIGSGSADFALPLPNGQVLAMGDFDRFNGAVANNLVRLTSTGAVDATFNPGAGANNYVGNAALLPSGKILIAGYFSRYNGTARNGLARLNADGSLDATFLPTLGPNSSIDNLTVQPDGKILVAGYLFTNGNPTEVGLVRLLPDGVIDNTFAAPTTYAGGTVLSNYGEGIAVQPDGKIVVADFSGSRGGRVARLNANGSVDATFQTGALPGFNVFSFTLTPSGNILVAGRNALQPGSANRALVQLTNTGALSATFQPSFQTTGTVTALVQQADGKLVAGGNFSEIDGQAIQNLARFNPNGTLDAAYTGGNNLLAGPTEMVVQPDGRLVVLAAGTVQRLLPSGAVDNSFAPPNLRVYNQRGLQLQSDGRVLVWGTPFTNQDAAVVRLLPSGANDLTFTPSAGFSVARFTRVDAINLQPNGKILVAGSYAQSGATATVVTVQRLESTGTQDASFTGSAFAAGPNGSTSILSLAVQADGKVVVGGQFGAYAGTPRTNVARLNANGTLDAGFGPPVITGFVNKVLLQPNGRVLLGGFFTALSLPANLARLLTDGQADATFGATAVPNSSVRTLLVQPDGKIVLGGFFSTLSGQVSHGLARITASNVLHAAAPQAVAARTEAWPVPAHAVLNVAPAPDAHPEFIDLLDGLGRPVLHHAVAGHGAAALDLAALAAGTYLLRVTYTEGTVVRRVQVQ